MERKGREKGNGGLCLFYKPHLRPHKWVPVVSDNCKYIEKERQWLLLNNGKEKVAILHCYLACQNSRGQDFLKWNEDLLHMMTQEIDQLKQQGFIILSLGDYNSHIGRVPGLELNNEDVNENGELFLNFIRLTNLTIINTLPVARGVFTRFMSNTGRDSGRSLIDYGLIDSDHSSYVSSFIIDADARYDCGSDHALLTAKLKFGHNPSVKWEFNDVLRFNLSPTTNYKPFAHRLDQLVKQKYIHNFEQMSVDQKLEFVSEALVMAGKDTIGYKVKKKKPRPLPKSLRDKIKAKNELAKKLRENPFANNSEAFKELSSMKLEIKNSFAEMKLRKRTKIRARLLHRDPHRKKFWRFLRNQAKAAGCISGLYNNQGEMVFDQEAIEKCVLDHFSNIFKAQAIPVFPPDAPTDCIQSTIDDIDQVLRNPAPKYQETTFEDEVCSLYTMTELGRVLDSLPDEKACGVDGIPNELLKHSGECYRRYLLLFLNQIISEGEVPAKLNTGKCILVHKLNSLHVM